VPERLRSTGQGVLALFAVSLGGITSSLMAGFLLEALGPAAPYAAGAGLALLLTAALPLWLPRPSRPQRREDRA